MNVLQNVLHEESINNITENICKSALHAEMQMLRDIDLVTPGLCVRTVTIETEPRDPYAMLVSSSSSSSAQTGVKF